MEPEGFNQNPPQAARPSVLHQITPLSKYLAMALFILLPFVGGYIGYIYAPAKIIEKEVIREVNSQKVDSKNLMPTFEYPLPFGSMAEALMWLTQDAVSSHMTDYNIDTDQYPRDILVSAGPGYPGDTVTVEEFLTHDSPDNCLVAENRHVYDITALFWLEPYFPSISLLQEACGTDIRQLLTAQPVQPGSLNTARFRYALANFYIGALPQGLELDQLEASFSTTPRSSFLNTDLFGTWKVIEFISGPKIDDFPDLTVSELLVTLGPDTHGSAEKFIKQDITGREVGTIFIPGLCNRLTGWYALDDTGAIVLRYMPRTLEDCGGYGTPVDIAREKFATLAKRFSSFEITEHDTLIIGIASGAQIVLRRQEVSSDEGVIDTFADIGNFSVSNVQIASLVTMHQQATVTWQFIPTSDFKNVFLTFDLVNQNGELVVKGLKGVGYSESYKDKIAQISIPGLCSDLPTESCISDEEKFSETTLYRLKVYGSTCADGTTMPGYCTFNDSTLLTSEPVFSNAFKMKR